MDEAALNGEPEPAEKNEEKTIHPVRDGLHVRFWQIVSTSQ